MNNIIYNKKEADSLTESEKNEIWRNDAEILKSNLILRNNPNINNAVGSQGGMSIIKSINNGKNVDLTYILNISNNNGTWQGRHGKPE